jgi:hypothetical protein
LKASPYFSGDSGTSGLDFLRAFANMRRVVRAIVLCGLVSLGCGDPEPAAPSRPDCLASVDADGCSPLVPAEFPALFSDVFGQSCTSSGASCHGAEGQQGGLAFVDPDEAYELLLGTAGTKARVEAGDAACSELIVRLDSPGQPWSMPPGAPLSEGIRCSIRRWVAQGARRTP